MISRVRLRDYVRLSGYKHAFAKNVIGMVRMNHVVKIGLGVALSFMTLAQAAAADDFRLSNNQRIACSRGLSAGKLNTSTCKSYA